MLLDPVGIYHAIMRTFFATASRATLNGSNTTASAFRSCFAFKLPLQQ